MSAAAIGNLARCPRCAAVNRLRADVPGAPRCGRCGTPLEAAGEPLAVTDASFESAVLRASRPVLLDCWAGWCGPCRMLAPTIDALAADLSGRVVVAKLDVDANPETASRLGISGIPAILFFRNGELVDRMTGVQPKGAILARLAPLLA